MPQSGRPANEQLHTRLEKEGYYETTTTTGLWHHKWCPNLFSIIVDAFGVKYIGKCHADHFALVLQKYHKITIDWEGNKCAGIDLEWNYTKRTFRLMMEN